MISLSGLKCGFNYLGNSSRLFQSLAEGVNVKTPLVLGDRNAAAVILLSGKTSARDISNSNRASVTRINRAQFVLHYPTTVVNPDGSTFTIRYTTPRKIIKLPVDVTQLSESDRFKRLERRKVKTKVKLEDEFEGDSFDTQKYIKYIKKWRWNPARRFVQFLCSNKNVVISPCYLALLCSVERKYQSTYSLSTASTSSEFIWYVKLHLFSI